MPTKFLAILKVLISIGLAFLLLYLVFKNIEWVAFWEKAQSVEYTWVIVSILLSIVAYVARAYRWNLLLAPLGYQLKTSRTTLAVLIGYMANLALPRLGEITRCGILNRNDKVAMPAAFGTVVAERIVDFLSLLFMIFLSLILESERLLTFLKDAYHDLVIPGYLVFILVGIGVISLFVLIYLFNSRHRLKGKFAEIIQGFIQGLISLKNVKNLPGFILSTVTLWVVYYLMSYIIIFSLPETSHLGLGAGFMLLVTGGIAISIPVQSGFGTYHGMIAGMLLLYGIDTTTGVFLATLLHTSQIVAIALFGSIALFISFLIQRRTSMPD